MYSTFSTSESGFGGFCSLENLRKLDIPYIHIDWARIPNVNEKMRAILVDWIIQVAVMFKFRTGTILLAIKLIDLFLSRYEKSVVRDKLQLYGIACLSLAVKQQEITCPPVKDYVFVSCDSCSEEEILEMELEVFLTLKGRIKYPTLVDYSRIFSAGSSFTSKLHSMVKLLGLASTLDYKVLKFSTEEVAVALNWIVANSKGLKAVITVLDANRIDLCCRFLYGLFRRLEKSTLKACRTFGLKFTGFASYSELINSLLSVESVFDMEWVSPSVFYSLEHINPVSLKEGGKLGEGTFGKVYLGNVDGKEWVVKESKMIREDGLSSEFIRELNALIAIYVLGMGGVYTVECYGFHVDNEKEYIFLEKANSSLHSFLNAGNTFSKDDLMKAVTDLFRALDYLHSVGLMHRDIKSQNILVFLGSDGIKLKICDFGLARGAGEAMANGNAFSPVVCTFCYRPPELLIPDEDFPYGPSIDVWSLVCVVMEMITGKIFFPGECEEEQIFLIAKKCILTKEFRDKVPEAVKNITPERNWLPEDNLPLKKVLEGGFECDPSKRITAGQAYELLMNACQDSMQIEVLTPPKNK